ncbi:hypothetical protein A2U01_0097347, partial [Trifolium medium]|nr:hypothetical protein [Trifolium medium]
EEELVQGSWFFNAHCLGEVAARTQASLEQIFLHIIDRVDLHSFFVEPLYEVSE